MDSLEALGDSMQDQRQKVKRLEAENADLQDLLRAAVARIELANAEGDDILSAWLPDARKSLEEVSLTLTERDKMTNTPESWRPKSAILKQGVARMKHTPTPWGVQITALNDPGRWTIVSENDTIATLNLADDDQERDDALYIVACVNACEGTDNPEGEIAQLRQEKAELLEMANLVLKHPRPVSFSKIVGGRHRGMFRIFGHRLDKLAAAIDKATP